MFCFYYFVPIWHWCSLWCTLLTESEQSEHRNRETNGWEDYGATYFCLSKTLFLISFCLIFARTPLACKQEREFRKNDGSLNHLAHHQHLFPHRSDGLGWSHGRVHPSSALVRAPLRLPRTPYTLLCHNNSYNPYEPSLHLLPLEAEASSQGLGDEGGQDGRLLGSWQMRNNHVEALTCKRS